MQEGTISAPQIPPQGSGLVSMAATNTRRCAKHCATQRGEVAFMRNVIVVSLAVLTAGMIGPAQTLAATATAVVRSIDLQKARADALKTKGKRPYYTKRFDLSGLPDYRPLHKLSGTIRQWGSNYLADGKLEKYFEVAFHRYYPNVKFVDNLSSTFLGIAGLYTKQADLAPMGRKATWDELQAYQRVFGRLPVEIVMATGSYDVSGWTSALVVFVNKSNPISKLTLAQLDGIFGAQRDGGWKDNSWDESAARGPEKNIRTWGQLGLTGAWANKPIHVYGYNLNYHFPRDFADKVFGGGYKWNETMREFSNKVGKKTGDFGKLRTAGAQMTAALVDDKYGITYSAIQYGNDGVKPVALAETQSGPYVPVTIETVQDRTYPLAREVYFYANRGKDGQMDPVVTEYLKFIVSRQGQELVQRDGKYLPLTAKLAGEQLKKLNDIEVGKARR